MSSPFEQTNVEKTSVKTPLLKLDVNIANRFPGGFESIAFSGTCSGVEGLQNLIEYLEVIKRDLIRQNQSHAKRKTR